MQEKGYDIIIKFDWRDHYVQNTETYGSQISFGTSISAYPNLIGLSDDHDFNYQNSFS